MINNFRLVLILCLFLGGVQGVRAQYYVWGQPPASLRWKQIVTPNFQILFPSDYAEQAAYIADVLEYTYGHGSHTLGHRPRKVPVILHNHTVVSNGFVSWAPARLEMFNTPPQDNDGHDWLESLAVHEFRHVVQVDKLNQGLTKILTYLFGQQATGAVLGLYVPLWFLEGDAVVVETGLTHSGRGRLPAFEQGLRAQVLEKEAYSFDKALLGSLRDYVPNHYELGYQLVANTRALYGVEVWDHVLNNVARRPHTLFPFTRGIRQQTGLSKKGLYYHIMHHLDSVWTRQHQRHEYTIAQNVETPKDIFANYHYPTFINDTTMLVFKNALDDIPRVVALSVDGREEVLFTTGFMNGYTLSSDGRRVVWSEQRRSLRWEHLTWSEVHVYDLDTGRKRRLTRRTRYFAPAISPDGTMIAAAEVTNTNDYSVVVLDVESGELLKRYDTPDNDFLMTPSWHGNSLTIMAVALGEDGKRIVVTDKDLGGFTTVFHAGRTDISRPRFFSPDGIFFNGAFSGIDNVYALDIPSREVKKVVSSHYGARDADLSPDGSRMVWSAYSAMGYGIHAAAPALAGGKLLQDVSNHANKLYDVLAAQEGAVVTRSHIPRKEYLAIPYYKAAGLLNFHSWGPIVVDADNMTANPGFSVMSQNPLSTAVAVLGYDYDLMEQQGRFFADLRYMGLFPVLGLRAETTMRESFYRDNDGNRFPFLWRENIMRFGGHVPLWAMRGAWFMGLQPSLHTSITRVLRTDDSPTFFRRNDITSMEYRLFAYVQHRTVPRDMRTRWGLVADFNYRHTPFDGGDMGSIVSGRAIAFLPGLLRHNSLRLSASCQRREGGVSTAQTINYSYMNMVMYPRGITGRNDDEVTILSADYAMPLFYPDWRIGPLLYIKRFSINAFYDSAMATYTVLENNDTSRVQHDTLQSYGLDLMSRLNILRAFADFDLGVRVMFPSTQNSPQFQFLWSVSLF